MKFTLRHLAILTAFSLLILIIYQAFWLYHLYTIQLHDYEVRIQENMRIADFHEIVLRAKNAEKRKDTLQMEVGASINFNQDDGNGNTTVTQYMRKKNNEEVHILSRGKHQKEQTQILINQGSRQRNINIKYNQDSDTIKGAKHIPDKLPEMDELIKYMQKSLQSALYKVSRPDIVRYDSLLQQHFRTLELPESRNLYLIIQTDSLHTDTLGRILKGNMSNTTSHFIFQTSDSPQITYHLYLPNLRWVILQRMAGIFIASILLLLIIGGVFILLVRIIRRQRTLEEMKSDFTNNITHELKTPIAVAYAANDALLYFRKDEQKEGRERYLNIIREQLDILSRLVEQILSTSMEQRKNFHLQKSEVKLDPLVSILIEQHRLKAGKPVNFQVEINPPGLTAIADPVHLTNIISNLIDNAIKYSVKQASITIRCTAVSVGNNVKCCIEVSDKGIGIAAEHIPYIFDKFYRIPKGNLHDVKGYGLGLFYVRTMVEKHGGTITVKSTPHKGTTFTIIL